MGAWKARNLLAPTKVMELLLDKLAKTNADFLASMSGG